MTREKYSEELMANIVVNWKMRKIDKAKIARKFDVSDSGLRRFITGYETKSKKCNNILKNFDAEFQNVEMPDEHLQGYNEKIAFYLAEAEKYKSLAKSLEKREKILLEERKNLFVNQVEKCIEHHVVSQIDGEMSHEEFMDFFTSLY